MEDKKEKEKNMGKPHERTGPGKRKLESFTSEKQYNGIGIEVNNVNCTIKM